MRSLFSMAIAFLFLLVFIVGIGVVRVSGGDVMIVEADIYSDGSDGGGSGEEDGGENEIISIEVPNYLDFNGLVRGGASEELKVYVNNTGNVAIRVTPQIINYAGDIFNNLYFREYKTSNGTNVPFKRIGEFSFGISKPASGKKQGKYFYTMLDLSNYSVPITSDMINHQAQVKFYAVKQ